MEWFWAYKEDQCRNTILDCIHLGRGNYKINQLGQTSFQLKQLDICPCIENDIVDL